MEHIRNKFRSLQVVSSLVKGHISPSRSLGVLLITLLRIWEMSRVLLFTYEFFFLIRKWKKNLKFLTFFSTSMFLDVSYKQNLKKICWNVCRKYSVECDHICEVLLWLLSMLDLFGAIGFFPDSVSKCTIWLI